MRNLVRAVPVLVVLALLQTSPASATQRACYPAYCTHVLRIGSERVRWVSGHRFAALNELDAYWGTHRLTYWNSGCRSYLSGYGITVSVSACERGASRLSVEGVNMRPGPVTLRLVYG